MKIDKVEEIQIELPITYNEWRDEYKHDELTVRALFNDVYEKSKYKDLYGDNLTLTSCNVGSIRRFDIVMRHKFSGEMDYNQRMDLIERIFNEFCALQKQYFVFRKLQNIVIKAAMRC